MHSFRFQHYEYILFPLIQQPPNPVQQEKTEEEKLLAKYPTAGSGLRGNGPSGHSAFLQKRLQKGVSLCILCMSMILINYYGYYLLSKNTSTLVTTKWPSKRAAASSRCSRTKSRPATPFQRQNRCRRVKRQSSSLAINSQVNFIVASRSYYLHFSRTLKIQSPHPFFPHILISVMH